MHFLPASIQHLMHLTPTAQTEQDMPAGPWDSPDPKHSFEVPAAVTRAVQAECGTQHEQHHLLSSSPPREPHLAVRYSAVEIAVTADEEQSFARALGHDVASGADGPTGPLQSHADGDADHWSQSHAATVRQHHFNRDMQDLAQQGLQPQQQQQSLHHGSAVAAPQGASGNRSRSMSKQLGRSSLSSIDEGSAAGSQWIANPGEFFLFFHKLFTEKLHRDGNSCHGADILAMTMSFLFMLAACLAFPLQSP